MSAGDDRGNEGPRIYGVGELSDERDVSGLSRRVELLTQRIEDGFALITTQLLKAIERLTNKTDDQADDIADLKREQSSMRVEQEHASKRLDALEAQVNPAPKRTRKKK